MPELRLSDCEVLINAFIQEYGFYKHQTASYDDFLKNGIPYILQKLFTVKQISFANQRRKTDLDKLIQTISYEGRFTNVSVNPRSEVLMYSRDALEFMDPITAVRTNKTLRVNIYLSMLFKMEAVLTDGTVRTREEKVEKLQLGGIAVPVFSEFTKFYNKTPQLLFAQYWDPQDIGCQLILNGKPIVYNNSEESKFNKFNFYRNNPPYKHELTRAQIVSRDGDSFENSAETIVRHFDNDIITVMIKIYETKIHIPLYSMLRLLGMPNDKAIVDAIMQMPESMYTDIERQIVHVIDRCFTAPLAEFDDLHKFKGIEICNTSAEIVQFLTRMNLKSKSDGQIMRYFNNDVEEHIDVNLLPHLGQKPEARIKKAMYICIAVKKILMISLNILEGDDRDSALQKRWYTCGTSMTKQFKHEFNKGFVKTARKMLMGAFDNNEFTKVNVSDVLNKTMNIINFEKHMTRAMRSAEFDDDSERTSSKMKKNRNHLRTEPDARKSRIFTHSITLYVDLLI